jgi:hypothetical protein
MGMARVKAIKSTNFGASGTGGLAGVPSFQGGVAAASQSAGQPLLTADPPMLSQRGQAAPAARTINLIIEGDPGSPTQTWIRDSLIPGLSEALGDGVVLNVAAP